MRGYQITVAAIDVRLSLIQRFASLYRKEQ